MIHKDGLCLSYFILACSILICSGIAFWLYNDTELEKYIDYNSKSKKLLFYKQYEDNFKLRNEILAEIFDDEIDLIWLNFVKDEPDGHVKLQLYSRLLAGTPDREETYQEIAAIITDAPKEYPVKEKIRYLIALKAIKGVHLDLLEKYSLFVTAENK